MTHKEGTIDWSLRQYPCVHGFRKRHPNARRLAGTLILEFEIHREQAVVRSVRPGQGNVDGLAAQCLRTAWRWTSLGYPAPGYPDQTLHVEWPFKIFMRADYPDVPPGWEDPSSWGMLSHDSATYPPNWSELAERLLWQSPHYASPGKVGSPVSIVLSDPRDLIGHFPLLADELYEGVFSESAAQRYRQTDCSSESAAKVSGQTMQKLATIFVIKDGRALIDWRERAGTDAARKLSHCLAKKLGFTEGAYSVPGETDATILTDWPVEVSARRQAG
jgi:hypothetical protein